MRDVFCAVTRWLLQELRFESERRQGDFASADTPCDAVLLRATPKRFLREQMRHALPCYSVAARLSARREFYCCCIASERSMR